MSGETVIREKADSDPPGCLGCLVWSLLFGAIGMAVTVWVGTRYSEWIWREDQGQSHATLAVQMEMVKRGESTCLVDPEPPFIGELLADADCAAKVRDIIFRDRVSDERLGRLQELPNLISIAFVSARDCDSLLEQLRGMATIEEVVCERSSVSRRGIECIASFPNLRLLSLWANSDELDALRNHESLESLSLVQPRFDDALLSILRSLPHLRRLEIEFSNKLEGDGADAALREALPACECRVTYD